MNRNEHIRPLRHMLREIGELCENASMTGSLSGGEGQAARRFNSCLRQIRTMGLVADETFEELDEATATYANIGVEAKMLASYLRGTEREGEGEGRDRDRWREHRRESSVLVRLAPFVGREDLAKLIRQQLESGSRIDTSTLTQIAPFVGSEILSELISAHLNEENDRPKAQAPQAPTPPTQVSEAPAAPTEVHAYPESLDDLIARLRQPGIEERERHEIALRIANMR